MDFQHVMGRMSPDLARVLRRFPLTIVFAAAGTLVLIVGMQTVSSVGEEEMLRLFAGAVTGGVLALAGRLFAESRPDRPLAGFVLSYVLPFAGAALFEIRGTDWLALPTVPAAAVMWLSVSAFTRIGAGAERHEIEDRFWWLNERALISGAIAAAASLIFFLGMLAIDRSLDLLFGISLWELMMQWVMPVVFCFLAPVYWLAVLPRLEDYDSATLGKPDFLTQAIGFVGQFVLTPLLFIYALILLAYGLQIAVTQTLPVGVLGWLVMDFVVAGAANWLILHPGFLRDRALSRLFRRFWFWATLLPLGLFAIGLFVRIDAYGLTPERMLLLAGGLWAAVLALLHLLPGRRGDIRLVPALAGIAFVALSFGPFNLIAAADSDQARRFGGALDAVRAEGGAGWTPELAAQADGALDYLVDTEGGRARLGAILADKGYDVRTSLNDSAAIASLIDLPPQTPADRAIAETLVLPTFQPVTTEGTPLLLGEVTASYGSAYPGEQAGLLLEVGEKRLTVTAADAADNRTVVDLSGWLDRQTDTAFITDPVIDFALGTRRFRLVARAAQVNRPAPDAPAELVYLSGWLFSDSP